MIGIFLIEERFILFLGFASEFFRYGIGDVVGNYLLCGALGIAGDYEFRADALKFGDLIGHRKDTANDDG